MTEKAPIEHGFWTRVHRGYNRADKAAEKITKGTLNFAKEAALIVIGLNPPATVRIEDAIIKEDGTLDFVRVPAEQAFREASEAKKLPVSDTVFIGPQIPMNHHAHEQAPKHDISPFSQAAP